VKHLTMLVTAEGQWVIEDSAEFLTALGDPDPDYDATSFAVKNLGFIKFQMFDDSIIEIELHPRNVELPALLAVQQQLMSSRVQLFRIRYFDTAWHSEITVGSERAMARLAELCSPSLASPPTDRFIAEPLDHSILFNDQANPLSLMIQKWRMSFGFFEPSVITFAIKQQLLSRMMIIGVKPHGIDPMFRFIGDGFPWTDDGYKLGAIGRRVEDQPDKDYGDWVAEFYKSAARTGQPRYDRVTAAIQGWQGKSKTNITRYERLLLPWKTPSSEIFVTLSSKTLADDEAASPLSSEADNSVVRKLAKSA